MNDTSLRRARTGLIACIAVATVLLGTVSTAHAAVTGMQRVSLGPSGQLWGTSTAPGVSADGRYVVFESDAPLVAAGSYDAGGPSIYVRDRQTGATTLVSRPALDQPMPRATGPSHKPVISADGAFVVFSSSATNLTGPWDGVTTAGIYRWERATNAIQRVDVSPGGTPFAWNRSIVDNAQDWWYTSVSEDGRFVAYTAPAGSGSSQLELFRRDMLTGEIVTVSTGRGGSGSSAPATHASMSRDGSKIAFSTSANLFSLATYTGRHVYLRDLVGGTMSLVSAPDPALAGAADSSDWPSISASGTVVAFVSSASNLVTQALNAVPNVLVRDLEVGTTRLVSIGNAGPATGACFAPAVSPDGRYVAFQSAADNQKVDGSQYPYYSLFVRDRLTGALSATGIRTFQVPVETGASTQFTGDGRYVVFSSESVDLVSGDTNDSRDAFLFEYRYRKTPTLSTPKLSTSYVRRSRSFYVSGSCSRHSGAQGKLEIRVYRRLSTGTKLYKTYTVYTGLNSIYYKKKISLPYTGKWCVRVYHPECETYRSAYSSYRYFTVYR